MLADKGGEAQISTAMRVLALAQLDGYKRPLVSSLSGNLQRFGMEKVGKLESLQEIIADMTETNEVNAAGEAPFAHHQTGPLIKSQFLRRPE